MATAAIAHPVMSIQRPMTMAVETLEEEVDTESMGGLLAGLHVLYVWPACTRRAEGLMTITYSRGSRRE